MIARVNPNDFWPRVNRDNPPSCRHFLGECASDESALHDNQSQPDCTNNYFVFSAGKPSVTALSRAFISRDKSGTGQTRANPSRNHDDSVTLIIGQSRGNDEVLTATRELTEPDALERQPLQVRRGHRDQQLLPTWAYERVLTREISRARMAGRDNPRHALGGIGLIDFCKCNCGHVSSSVSPPRHTHSNAVAEAVL